jgi:hypothetical protein
MEEIKINTFTSIHRELATPRTAAAITPQAHAHRYGAIPVTHAKNSSQQKFAKHISYLHTDTTAGIEPAPMGRRGNNGKGRGSGGRNNNTMKNLTPRTPPTIEATEINNNKTNKINRQVTITERATNIDEYQDTQFDYGY